MLKLRVQVPTTGYTRENLAQPGEKPQLSAWAEAFALDETGEYMIRFVKPARGRGRPRADYAGFTDGGEQKGIYYEQDFEIEPI